MTAKIIKFPRDPVRPIEGIRFVTPEFVDEGMQVYVALKCNRYRAGRVICAAGYSVRVVGEGFDRWCSIDELRIAER